MKTNWFRKVLSFVLASVMAASLAAGAAPVVRVYAEEGSESVDGSGGGKYIKEVYMAYGENEEKAAKWLTDHGWEPVKGDFNAGKASKFDDSMAVVMGIHRTDDKYNAITDMAVMNMKGGYSFPEYEKLLEEKKADINEFVNAFLPVLEEYRINYNKKESDSGKKRAELAYEMLNKFVDGGESEPYAKNDTGEHLGDLFLEPIRQEGNKNGIDLEQVIMESSGAGVIAVETALSLAADPSEDTWLERAAGLTGEDLVENIGNYVPEAAEMGDIADSAALQFLAERFGDAASGLSTQWAGIHEKMLWYESYNEEHDLWPAEDESEEDNGARIKAYFDELKKNDPESYEQDYNEYYACATIYVGMYDTPYEGDWGETLGDFFNPADGEDYGENEDNFLPMAAALSDGQRAALELIPLTSLIMLGFQTEESVDQLFPNVDEMLGDAKEISIYSGINRGIFRGGVALTSEALMESSSYDPFNDLWSFSGIYNITCYAAAIASVPLMGAGIAMWVLNRPSAAMLNRISWLKGAVKIYGDSVQHEIEYITEIADYTSVDAAWASEADVYAELQTDLRALNRYNNELNQLEAEVASMKPMSMTGRILTGIGGAILIGAAFAKGYQMYKYYNKTFTQIPTMIVDEADIVTYTKDKDGKEVKNVEFDQYVYYQAVRCNRQELGKKLSDWQDGVDKYEEWGCGDVADLNGDFGQEWLALYTVKSEKKGAPILADSLTIQYGKKDMPSGCSKKLHLFTYTNAVDLGDTAWSFNNKKHGVYFFWDEDTNAFAAATASAFGAGHLALVGFGGLILGTAGATLVLTRKRRKDEPEAA